MTTETALLDLEVSDVDVAPMDEAPKERTRTRRVTGKAGTAKASSVPAYRKGVIAKGFTQIYGSVGIGLMMVDPHCASAVMENAEACAESLETLARDNPAVRRVLMSLISANAWSSVIMAHAPIILAIAKHHVPAVQSGFEKLGEKMVGGMEAAYGEAAA